MKQNTRKGAVSEDEYASNIAAQWTRSMMGDTDKRKVVAKYVARLEAKIRGKAAQCPT